MEFICSNSKFGLKMLIFFLDCGDMAAIKKKESKASSEPNQTSKMKLFAKIINGCQPV